MKPLGILVCLLIMTLVSGDKLRHHSPDHIALLRHENVQYSGGPLANAWSTVGDLAIVAGVLAIGIGAYTGIRSLWSLQKPDQGNTSRGADGNSDETGQDTTKGNAENTTGRTSTRNTRNNARRNKRVDV
jgi:hypothetical protein